MSLDNIISAFNKNKIYWRNRRTGLLSRLGKHEKSFYEQVSIT